MVPGITRRFLHFTLFWIGLVCDINARKFGINGAPADFDQDILNRDVGNSAKFGPNHDVMVSVEVDKIKTNLHGAGALHAV